MTAGMQGTAETAEPAEPVEFRAVAFDSDDAQRLLGAFMTEIAELYEGWLPSRGPSAVAADFEPPHGRFVVGYSDGKAVACGGVKEIDRGTGEIKRLYVAPEARGRGVGRALLGALEHAAREMGCAIVRLDTGRDQPAALRLFDAAGYRRIPDYNGNPFARHWFEKPL